MPRRFEIKSINDYRREEEEFNARKAASAQDAQLKAAKIEQLGQPKEVDARKLGEQAFLKIGQGIELTPQEESAARFLDAKSGGAQFDPVSGLMTQKPSLFDKIPLGSQPIVPEATEEPTPVFPQMEQEAPTQSFPAPEALPPTLPQQEAGEFEQAFNAQLAAAEGNPKLQQKIKTDYAKSKMTPNVDALKAAGFSDRMIASDAIIGQPNVTQSGTDAIQGVLSSIPLLGNYIISSDRQSFNQAQRDFINAQLRRESGAVISDEEFDNAEEQYFPKAGDDAATLKQKAENRAVSVKNMERSAGAFYEGKAPEPKLPKGGTEEIKFNLKKKGFTTEQITEYLTQKGIK